MTPAVPSAGRLPLTAMLSAALVAFTIEFDNEAERQLQHRTTWHDSASGGVWLVSMVMWLNCMRYLGAEPITVAELTRLARTDTNLDGMRRWGYLKAEPASPGNGPGRGTAKGRMLVHATAKGQKAQQVWHPLTDVIEERWADRFGTADLSELRQTLAALVSGLGAGRGSGLPDCLPILGHGLYSLGKGPGADRYSGQFSGAAGASGGTPGAGASRAGADVTGLAFPWLLARALLAFAIEFERESALSLAISANLLRVLTEDGVRLRDVPALSGVSTESIAMASGFTGKRGLTVIESDPAGGPWKLIRLTPAGAEARSGCLLLRSSIEERWEQRCGSAVIAAMRAALQRLARPAVTAAAAGEAATGAAGPGSLLFAGLEPHPGNWRASVRRPAVLPQFPMVLHRGGYPDGS